MSALPNTTFLAGLDTGVFVSLGAKGWTDAAEMHRQLKDVIGTAKEARLRFGLVLVELRKRTPAGMWAAALEGSGIHRNTATSALKAAGNYLGLSREQMAEVMQCPVSKLTAYPNANKKLHSLHKGCAESSGSERTGDEGEIEELLEDTTQYDTPEQLERTVQVMREHREKREREAAMGQSGQVTVTVDAQGLGTVEPAAARDQAVAGRIGPELLSKPRRPDVAGQMTMAALFEPVEVAVQRQDIAGRGDQARAIVQRHMDEALREIADLERAA